MNQDTVLLFPLSKPQKSIWNMEQFFGGSIANITGSAVLGDIKDIQSLQTALNKTVEQCYSLRIHVKIQDGVPMQYIKDYKPCNFEIVRFSSKGEFSAWVEALAVTPFDLDGDLYKIFIFTIEEQIGYVLHLHHLTADAWTLILLADIIEKNLKSEPVRANNYLDYLDSEQEYSTSNRYRKDKEYFMSCFEKCSEPVYLSDKQAKSTESNRLSITIVADEARKIQVFCKDNGVSPYSLFMNALATYIFRIKGAISLYIGTTVLNRSGKKEKETAGVFVNTVPVLFNIDETKSILENMQGNSTSIMNVFRHQKYQYSDLLKDVREEHGFTDRLYDVALNYQNAAFTGDNTQAQWHFCGSQGESLNIHINDRQNENSFHFDYDYQAELFTGRDIERLHGHLLNLIFDIIENPDKKPQDLKLLSDDEYNRIVYEFNDTAIDFPKDKCIHQLFEEQAAKTPEAVAVIFEDVEYTYRQINEMANAVAHDLRSRGVGRNDIVAIIARRSYKIIAAQLAILKAGGAYMPIDPNYPADRIDFMLDDAKCKIALVLGYDTNSVETITLDGELPERTGKLDNVNVSEDLCYVIYTSGSTGEPKGTILTHRNFNNFCNNNSNNTQVTIATSCKSFICLGAFIFDMASAEIYLALLNNHKLVLANDNQLENPSRIARLIEDYDIDFILTTPTRILSYLNDSDFMKAMRKLTVLCVGGEVLTQDMVDILKNHTDATILNGYGPAETTQGCTWTNTDGDLSIGKPIANTQIYILDKNMNPLPIGAVGELCIAGAGVGKGYLNRPKLTAEKFVDNPFATSGQVDPKSKMYKTGDLAKWREDGNIEYIGRMDNQVKIRGLRIELGEIESAISRCEGVKQNAVVVKTDDNGRQYICAYYIGAEVDIKGAKAELAKKLPQYMIPHFFIEMEQFPTTPSGKIDRKAFPVPSYDNAQSDIEYIAPVTEQEKAIVAIMENVLNVPKIGINDNFFDLGGDSLNVIEFTLKAQQEGNFFTVQDIFDNPTAALLVKRVTEGYNQNVKYNADDFTEIHKLLEKNRIDENIALLKQSLGDVLITGATGWLGAHILDEFLLNESGIAYCLIRGDDLNESQNRLNKMLEYYFDDKYVNCDRIKIICGDITENIILENPIDTIIHCAADVKHYGSYEHFYDTNVKGTKNIIEIAKKNDAKLFHISTSAVSGNNLNHNGDYNSIVFDETKLFIGQSLENVYVRSKFESEIAVLLARVNGLKSVVIRVGNLTNRSYDLKFQKNHHENGTLMRLKAFKDLCKFPKEFEDFELDFSPVSDTAKSIIVLAQYYNENYSVFHAYNNKPLRLIEFVKSLQDLGAKVDLVSTEKFIKAVQEAGNSSETAYINETFINDISIDGKLLIKSNITLKNDFTTWFLNKTDFNWSNINGSYLVEYVNYFKNIGYWRVEK
jgi:amino acid adenylation domain-containing protein/thioester reductase-like protein